MHRMTPALLLLMALAQVPVEGQTQEPATVPGLTETVSAGAETEAELAPAPAEQPAPGVKTMSGMSILGNEEAPKSLVIVPWKSSKLGDGLGVSNLLDGRPRAVDKEVFMRELHYFELRSGGGE